MRFAFSTLSGRLFFELEINGKETEHDFDWEGPAPAPVVDFLRREPVPVFASPALGTYHPEVRSMGDKIEDAALVAALDYAIDWALRVGGRRITVGEGGFIESTHMRLSFCLRLVAHSSWRVKLLRMFFVFFCFSFPLRFDAISCDRLLFYFW